MVTHVDIKDSVRDFKQRGSSGAIHIRSYEERKEGFPTDIIPLLSTASHEVDVQDIVSGCASNAAQRAALQLPPRRAAKTVKIAMISRASAVSRNRPCDTPYVSTEGTPEGAFLSNHPADTSSANMVETVTSSPPPVTVSDEALVEPRGLLL